MAFAFFVNYRRLENEASSEARVVDLVFKKCKRYNCEVFVIELERQYSKQLDIQMIFLYECERCHAVMRSKRYIRVPNMPAIQYISPADCENCRDKHVGRKDIVRHLPSVKVSLRAKCRYDSCEKEFNALPRWFFYYYCNSEFPDLQPVLIEQNAAKIKELIPEWQNHAFLVEYLHNLEKVTA